MIRRTDQLPRIDQAGEPSRPRPHRFIEITMTGDAGEMYRCQRCGAEIGTPAPCVPPKKR